MTYDMKLCEVRDETREETWQEAWQEASHERAVEDARRALTRGFAPDVVAELTGLPIDEVRALL